MCSISWPTAEETRKYIWRVKASAKQVISPDIVTVSSSNTRLKAPLWSKAHWLDLWKIKGQTPWEHRQFNQLLLGPISTFHSNLSWTWGFFANKHQLSHDLLGGCVSGVWAAGPFPQADDAETHKDSKHQHSHHARHTRHLILQPIPPPPALHHQSQSPFLNDPSRILLFPTSLSPEVSRFHTAARQRQRSWKDYRFHSRFKYLPLLFSDVTAIVVIATVLHIPD